MSKDYKKTARNNAFIAGGIGIVALAGGIIATSVSYNNAGPGDTYTIWWGPALVGVILIIKGVWNLITLKSQAAKLEALDKTTDEQEKANKAQEQNNQ